MLSDPLASSSMSTESRGQRMPTMRSHESHITRAILVVYSHFNCCIFVHISDTTLQGNYLIIVSGLAVYALLTNQTLLIALIFLIGGFTMINRLGKLFFDTFEGALTVLPRC